jgi:diguanylate cyclase (GGDEF)-like protein
MRFAPSGLSRASHAVTVVVVALGLGVLIAAACVALGLYREAHARAGQETHRLAVVLAEETAQALHSVDLVLSDLVREARLAQVATPAQFEALMSTSEVHRDLRARLVGLPQAHIIGVFSAEAKLLNSSWHWPPAAIDVSDRDYFQAARDGASEAPRDGAAGTPIVGKPVRNRDSLAWVVNVARRVTAADGRFLGVVGVAVDLKYFAEFHSAIGLPDGMRVNVVRRDGVILTSFPGQDSLVGQRLLAGPEWSALVAAGGGAFWGPGRLEDDSRLVSVQPVSGLPLVVNVGISRGAIFAAWWQQLVLVGLATTCMLGCLGLLLRALVTQFRHLEATEADLTRRNRELDAARTALNEESRLLEMTLGNMDQGLMMVTADGMVPVCNDRAIELLGLPLDLVLTRPSFEAIVDHQREAGEFSLDGADVQGVRDSGGIIDRPSAYERRRPNGTVLEVRSVPLPGGGMVRTYTDITERRRAEAQVRFAARHDALTGLANRSVFAERLEQAVTEAEANGTQRSLAVLHIDLDRFKQVNDTLGHRAGDELLRHVSRRMSGVLREADTFARMGGDEFALLMPDLPGPEVALAVAERLLRAVRQPFTLADGQARIGVSIGIACHPEHGRTGDELLNNADLALYRAKANGRDTFCVYDQAADILKQDQRILEAELHCALQDGQLALAFQPICDIRSQRIVGTEALLRWHHPTRGAISPGVFIPLAERTGLIIALGRWVLECACREALTWASPVRLSVNVSPSQLCSPGLVDEVRDVLAATGLPASRLRLEITESQLLDGTADVVATMTALRGLGVGLALDDFGTGHSSLSTLRAFPFSEVKIDRCFTQAMGQDERGRGLLEAILQVCRVLDLECVAEGVETTEQLELLRRLGCTHVQGFLIGRPEPPAAIRRTLWRAAAEARQSGPDMPEAEMGQLLGETGSD